MADILDSYAESNYSGISYGISGYSSHWKSAGQSFALVEGKPITSCRFYLSSYGTITGYCYAKIYAHTGTWGQNGKPTGDALAVSDTVRVSKIGESFSFVRFNFYGVNQFTPNDKVPYVIAFEYTVNNGSSNRVQIGIDSSTPSHSGNLSYKEVNWNTLFPMENDLIFYIYTGDTAPAAIRKNPLKIIYM
jgi:hypothetical protein